MEECLQLILEADHKWTVAYPLVASVSCTYIVLFVRKEYLEELFDHSAIFTDFLIRRILIWYTLSTITMSNLGLLDSSWNKTPI